MASMLCDGLRLLLLGPGKLNTIALRVFMLLQIEAPPMLLQRSPLRPSVNVGLKPITTMPDALIDDSE